MVSKNGTDFENLLKEKIDEEPTLKLDILFVVIIYFFYFFIFHFPPSLLPLSQFDK